MLSYRSLPRFLHQLMPKVSSSEHTYNPTTPEPPTQTKPSCANVGPHEVGQIDGVHSVEPLGTLVPARVQGLGWGAVKNEGPVG